MNDHVKREPSGGFGFKDNIRNRVLELHQESRRNNLDEATVEELLIAHGSPRIHPNIHYWRREARSSNAEVDYVITRKGKVVPIEVKSGSRGQMQSMYIFLNARNLEEGLRISGENFTAYDKIKTIPLYAVKNILHASI